jgi:preprotein translocase subunit SecF
LKTIFCSRRWTQIDTKTKTLALISIVALVAVAGILFSANQLNVNADTNSTSTITADNSTADSSTITTTVDETSQGNWCFSNERMDMQMHHRFSSGQVQVSDEFKENVTSIANADSDVQDLLNNGYNVTSVTPIFQSVVDGNGYVTTKASTAILTLTKDDSSSYGKAQVLVDLDQATVTKIYIETKTLIEK